MELPGSLAGRINSPKPHLGPLPRNLISFAIYILYIKDMNKIRIDRKKHILIITLLYILLYIITHYILLYIISIIIYNYIPSK